jgi:hypothetical protein
VVFSVILQITFDHADVVNNGLDAKVVRAATFTSLFVTVNCIGTNTSAVILLYLDLARPTEDLCKVCCW